MATWPWLQYGGSFIWENNNGRASLPGRCCENMDPELIGGCREGCCDDFRCKSCGKKWRYEYPD